MSSINDEIFTEEQAAAAPDSAVPEAEIVSQPFSIRVPEWLKAKTGAGDIDSYMNHPMNFSKTSGAARIIRGITGMLGNSFDYAWVDIVLGFFDIRRQRHE